MAGQEPVVDSGPANGAVIARVGVQRLLLRGEGVEQREGGLAAGVLVVPREQELDRKTIPSWAVVGTADHAIPLALQLAMAGTAHAHVTKVDAPHLSMISNPGTVTNVILQAVRATS
jgi:pimeloyl-ACP methyl ester carboxylesterase